MLIKNTLVLAKVESSYDTDPVPTKTDDAILVTAPEIKVDGELLTRDFVRSSLSPLAHVVGRKKANISFKTELKGSGTAGTAPDIGVLFKGCGMDEDIVASTSVTYTPLSSGHDSITLYAYLDGLLHKITGARGSFSLDLTAGKIPMVSWKFEGSYIKPTDVALPTGATYDTTKPEPILAAQFTAGSYSAAINALMFDMSNVLGAPGDMNANDGYGEIRITSRDPNGSFDPEAVLIATEDFWGDWESAVEKALDLQIGSTAGNIATIDIPKAVYREIGYGDREGIRTNAIPFTASGLDDELSIAFT